MANFFDGLLDDLVRPVTRPVVKPYMRIFTALVVLLIIIPATIFLPLNVYNQPWAIAMLTLLIASVVWLVGINPMSSSLTGLAGGAYGKLKGTGVVDGAESALRLLVRALTMITFMFVIEGTVATFVFFSLNKSAFVMLMLLAVASVYFGLALKVDTKVMPFLIGAMLAIFLICTLVGVRLAIPASVVRDPAALFNSAQGSWSGGSDCPAEGAFKVVSMRTPYTLVNGCAYEFDASELPFDKNGNPLFMFDGVGDEFKTRFVRELVDNELKRDRRLVLTPKEEVMEGEHRKDIVIAFFPKAVRDSRELTDHNKEDQGLTWLR